MRKDLKSIDAALNSPQIAIAKVFSCKSLSGLCTLEIHIAYVVGTKDRVFWRIWYSDGRGRWNTDLISVSDIEKVMSKIPPNEPFKVSALKPLYANKSSNSHGYLAAAFLAEGLIALSATEEGKYERCNADVWWSQLQALIDVGTDLLPETMSHGAGHTPVKVPKANPVAKKSGKNAAPTANG
jgi:hypothetical protein